MVSRARSLIQFSITRVRAAAGAITPDWRTKDTDTLVCAGTVTDECICDLHFEEGKGPQRCPSERFHQKGNVMEL